MSPSESLVALAPLAARVCPWTTDLAAPEADEDPDGPVRAMPMVLRLERQDQPSRTAVLEAAAAAALALCLDERSAPGGEWFDAVAAWCGAGRIRKLARRARTSHWRAVQDVPGVTAGELVRALVPGPVDEVPHEVRRLQIGGTDLPDDSPGPVDEGRPVIWLNPRVEQSTGKAAAQVGHASMILATVLAWTGGDPADVTTPAVRTASTSDWDLWCSALDDPEKAWALHGVAPVRDAGFTEVAPGTVTCIGQVRTGG
ncbi:peptidyl-tRNA hydrolase [Actinomycetospora sp. OC33-EN08]|uniref:Peptidyl-tRNA hydrolase n=1 Tax=Actinomycetospora aurantiaca TaxID=3129233 RepID=A0ABU8MM00_9PSEU